MCFFGGFFCALGIHWFRVRHFGLPTVQSESICVNFRSTGGAAQAGITHAWWIYPDVFLPPGTKTGFQCQYNDQPLVMHIECSELIPDNENRRTSRKIPFVL